VTGQIVESDASANENFYGTSNVADIIEGKVSPPEGSLVPALMAKIADKQKLK